jgi:endonuclease/exonuclease/phosphatase family metal-dependent hydrolase
VKALLTVFSLFRLTGYLTDPLLEREQVHAVVGEPTRFDRMPPRDGQLRIVSWNIAQGARYEEVRNTILSLSADIYLLQEVDLGVRRSGYRNVAKALADDLDLNWVFGGEFQEIGQSRKNTPARTGQAILSRYPIRDPSVLAFENQARLRWRLDPFQPRRGGRMALRAESGGVLVYNAHIESAKNDAFRHRQIDELLLDYRSGPAPGPVVFAGDFNTASAPGDSAIVECLTSEGFVDALGTDYGPRRTSIHHPQPRDWIFVRNLAPRRGGIVDVTDASDHFPLEASISVEPSLVMVTAH